MLLVSRPGLADEDTAEVFHYNGFLFFIDVKFQVFSGKIIIWWYSRFLSTSSCRGQLVVHPPSRIVSNPKDKKLP